MTLTRLIAKLLGRDLPNSETVQAHVDMKEEAAYQKVRSAERMSAMLGDFVHAFKHDQQRDIARRGE
jgi:predicted amidophosphoribosyltransferase